MKYLTRTYIDEATYFTMEPTLQQDGTTQELPTLHTVKGKLLKASTADASYSTNDLTTSYTVRFIFQTDTLHRIPVSTKLTLDGITYLTGIPLKYMYHQEIPLRSTEVI